MFSQLLLKDTPAMGIIKTIAITVISISAFVFVALFGRLPIFRKTPIGLLHRILLVHIPNALVQLDQKLTGRRITGSVRWFFHYLMNEPHPLVMILLVVIETGAEILFIPPSTKYIHLFPHIITIPIAIVIPHITLYKAHKTLAPVNSATHKKALSVYPYDYTLFHPNQICRTCNLSKPARSKHCPICKTCVEKQDHHCVWINNCVNRNNHIWFLALILSLMILLLYASILGYTILESSLQNRFVPPELIRGSKTAKKWSTRMNWWEYMDAWTLEVAMKPRIGAVTLLATLCFPLAAAFLIFHIYLFWAGMTTNESSKWSDLREDIYDDLVWKAKLEDMRVEYPTALDTKVDPGIVGWQLGRRKKAEWWLIRTRGGLQPLRQKWGGNDGEQELDYRWKRVRSLADVDNLYDLGFWGNAKDCLFHRD